ncbi:MAG: fibro-slime domain-containing protein [Fibrobacteria bacterium]|nr:fibro-slime domain-containing protein [Fibrobacteria bacterium]
MTLVVALASNSRADRTLMWLTDWYQGNLDSAVITQVSIPHYGDTGAAATGYYYGKTDLVLSRTKAYAPLIRVNTTYDNTGKPDSLVLPKFLDRAWYVLPGFNQGKFRGGMVNVMMQFRSYNHRYQAGPPPRVQLDTGRGTGQTGQLNQSSASVPGFLDNCVNDLNGDTIWIRLPAPDNVINPGYTGDKLVCTDHNPFFAKVGTIHVYNPWPGKTLYVQQGGAWYPLYPEPGRLGWQTTTLWANPTTDTAFKIRLASGKPGSSALQYMDAQGFAGSATGPAFDFSATPGAERWIMPPTSAGKAPTTVNAAPALRTVLMVQRPHWGASGVRVLWKGSDARYIAGSTQYCDWYTMPLYEGAIPDSIVLQHPLADTLYGTGNLVRTPSPMSLFDGWIPLKGKVAAGDTTWIIAPNLSGASIVPRPASQLTMCDTKVLAFSAYDYGDGLTSSSPYFYAPFAEKESGVLYPSGQNKGKTTDNCPSAGGGASKGLVNYRLNAQGRPEWSGKIDCDIGAESHGPQHWFDPLVIGGTQVNAFKCVPLTLKLDPSDGYYKYSSNAFFPLNQATSVPYGPATGSNFHFAMHAKASFEYVRGLTFKFKGDDDVWIFIDKKLALDLGGQHGEMPGEIDLDKLGLVEGKSYQFDMFYSERHQVGSNIGIQTTMNLVPTIDVVFDTAASGGLARDVRVKTIETTMDPSKCPEEGATSQRKELPGRANIFLIRPDGTQEEVDTLKYASAGLKVTEMFSHISIDTTLLKASGLFTTSGLYTVLISIGTEDLATHFTMVTANVDARGVMLDRDGDGRADSAFVHGDGASPAFVHPVRAELPWATAAGASAMARPAVAEMFPVPGDSAIGFRFAPMDLRTTCGPLGCSGVEGLVWGIASNGDTIKNALLELADGVAPVADSGRLVFGAGPTDLDTLVLVPSEAIAAAPAGVWAILGRDSGTVSGVALSSANASQSVTAEGKLLLLVPKGAGLETMLWARLGTAILDAGGNVVGTSSRWVRLSVKSSGRAALYDSDGDGRADSLHVFARGTLAAASAVLRWTDAAGAPDSRTWTVAPSTGAFGAVATTPALRFEFGATSCSGCTVTLRDAAGVDLVVWPLEDSVAPVALEGRYRFGSAQDTLQVVFSEAVAGTSPIATWLEWGGSSVGGVVSQTGVVGTGAAISFLLDPSNGAVAGWDSLRLAAGARAGSVFDASGKTVGRTSPWAPIRYGIAPFHAWLLDPSGRGRGTHVRVSLARSVPTVAVSSIDSFRLSWVSADGSGSETRSVAVSQLSWDGVSSWSGALATPFAVGRTGCAAGCLAEGTNSAGERSFATLQDSIAPMATRARLLYAPAEIGLDTLVLDLSEPWTGDDPARLADALAWVGGHATVREVLPMRGWSLAEGTSLRLVLATEVSTTMKTGDSARLAWLPAGSRVSDASGNRVGVESPWVRLEFGLRPPLFEVGPFRTFLDARGEADGSMEWEVPSVTHPQIEILELLPDGTFGAIDGVDGATPGGPALNDPSRVIGIDVHVNRPLDGILVIYDNLGTVVASVDLARVRALWSAGDDQERTLRIQWNATGPDHRLVGSGVYLIRAVLRLEDSEGSVLAIHNKIWKVGFHRKAQ